VDKLVNKDLVVRKPDLDDRRVVKIMLTSEGSRASQIVEQEKRKRVEAFLRGVTSDERRALLKIVKTVHGRMLGQEADDFGGGRR
jgi:DNA-binding MarR family transcriptional regulator